MINTVPQYSRMLDDQGVEMQPEHASPVGDSELTPLNHDSLAQLHQKPAVDTEQGSTVQGQCCSVAAAMQGVPCCR